MNNTWNKTCEGEDCHTTTYPQSKYCKRHREERKKEAVYLNQDAGFHAVIKLIENAGMRIIESHELNEGRYTLTKTKKGTYFICYKRDFFNSFGKIFEKEGESGVGETINVEDLKPVMDRVTDLVFVYENGRIYSISIGDFMEHSHRRKTDAENKVVRSVSVGHLKDFKSVLGAEIKQKASEVIDE